MRLKLYSSRHASRDIPNLVAVQHPSLNFLPTVLVCPLETNEALTEVRAMLKWGDKEFVVLCDLVRPINYKLLNEVGEADEATSNAIIEKVLTLLALP
jgi:mRNA-degrading endonuclease toxin of MazEF toxin-antitoxin module